ncbi:MAG: glycosyltransferase family 4 protein [Leptospiraceae bacterium]|nr:glycosyltransferase family 4 protein [Leptospiraceae bacterium]
MPLKIGMDVRMIQHSGIGVRIQNILESIRFSNDFEIFLFGDPQILSKYQIPPKAKIIPYNAKIYSIAEWFGHPSMKEMDYLDIPHFNVPLRFISKCIVTIHDLIPWVMKEYHGSFIKRLYLRIVLSSISLYAKKIITVSNYTKNDFIKYFGLPTNSIETIYNGINKKLYVTQTSKNILNFKNKYKLPKQYFLTVGIGKGHKNFDFLLQNLLDLWKSNSTEIDLVLAGAYEFKVELLNNLPEQFKSKVYSLPRIEDKEMPIMYQSAEALLYPSLYEGFGFPVVEAQSVNCPVISSNASVLPEILVDSALFFDPRSNEDFQNKVLDFCNMTVSKKKKLIQKGKTNSNRFSWNTSVSSIQNFYLSLF